MNKDNLLPISAGEIIKDAEIQKFYDKAVMEFEKVFPPTVVKA